MNEQKERLEQELRFLKESLEADVISKDEYEKGKERIERKLNEIGETPIVKEEIIEEPKEEEPKEEKPEIEIKEIKEQPTKIIGAEEEQEEKIVEESKEEQKEEEQKPKEQKPEETEEPEEEIHISKKWLYGLAIIIIAAILFFAIRSCEFSLPEKEAIEEFTPECSSDSDCKQQGSIGTCLNPGTKEAKCEFKEDAKTILTVINDQNCELCDSSRMKSTIKKLFPNAKITNLGYETTEAKTLINKLKIDALPAYIFDSDVEKTINFNDFKRALIKKEDSYVITNTASGANYYFERQEIVNKLDVFLTADMEEKVNNNLNEFLELFKDINFEKHIVTEKEKTSLKDELGITSYPSFLINNQVKFGGIQSSDSIKEKFCILNKLDECKKELRKNII